MSNQTNMSYCRFQNTRLALGECIAALEDPSDEMVTMTKGRLLQLSNGHADENCGQELSAMEQMREMCENFLELTDEMSVWAIEQLDDDENEVLKMQLQDILNEADEDNYSE